MKKVRDGHVPVKARSSCSTVTDMERWVFVVFCWFNFLFCSIRWIDALPQWNNPAEMGNKTREEIIKLRKCCQVGQVYHVSQLGSGECREISALNPQTFADISRELFFPEQSAQNFQISTGIPQDCTAQNIIRLEPNTRFADKIFPIQSGRLIVPHRFWIFEAEHYCMEDIVMADNYHKVDRGVFVCLNKRNYFPADVLDHRGRLQLDVIASKEEDVYKLSGKSVVRKCCDLNSVYSLDQGGCIISEGYSTQFFDDLLKNDSIFLRIGDLKCSDLQLTLPGTEFQLVASGDLRIYDGEALDVAIDQENYCLDDFFRMSEDNFPETENLVLYCADSLHNRSDVIEPLTSGQTILPKCCPSGSYLSQGKCHPVAVHEETALFLGKTLEQAVRLHFYGLDNYTISFQNNKILPCEPGETLPLTWNTGESNQDRYYVHLNDSLIIEQPLWKSENSSCHGNVWKQSIHLDEFCVIMEQIKTLKQTYFQPVLKYCDHSPLSVKVPLHFPILLLVSSVAMILTLIIYFSVPAQAVSRMVITTGSRWPLNKRRGSSRPTKLSQTLFGRTLLCHIFSLIVAFLSVVTAQLNWALPGNPGCIALGLIIYCFFMASFAWLTIICFDLWWQFRSPVRMPDNIRFIPYSIFGWGVPLLCTSVAAAAQFGTISTIPCNRKPQFGFIRCWFTGDESLLAFFYGPVSGLLGLNIFFFFLMVINLRLFTCPAQKEKTSKPKNLVDLDTEKPTARKNNANLALELLFIMGIPWIVEIISWLPAIRQHLTWSYYLLQIANILNLLRGVFIFIIFVLLRPNVIRHISSMSQRYLNKVHKQPLVSKPTLSTSLSNNVAQLDVTKDGSSKQNHWNGHTSEPSIISTTAGDPSSPAVTSSDKSFIWSTNEAFEEVTHL